MRDGSCVPLCRADLLTVVSDSHPETDGFRDVFQRDAVSQYYDVGRDFGTTSRGTRGLFATGGSSMSASVAGPLVPTTGRAADGARDEGLVHSGSKMTEDSCHCA